MNRTILSVLYLLLSNMSIGLLTSGAQSEAIDLSSPPVSRSAVSCRVWANDQDEQAIEKWSVQGDGSVNRLEGLDRLTRYCLGEPKPEIVGYDETEEAFEAYCSAHASEKICQDAVGTNEPPRAAGPMIAGDNAYDSGDYAAAMREWLKAAENGDPVAEYNIGMLYDFGRGVGRDQKAAAFWYRKSVEKQYQPALYNLAIMYLSGEGVVANKLEALRLLRMAAEKGHSDSQHALGVLNLDEGGSSPNYVEAFKWLSKASQQGNTSSKAFLGKMYELGLGVQIDRSQALELYEAALDTEKPLSWVEERINALKTAAPSSPVNSSGSGAYSSDTMFLPSGEYASAGWWTVYSNEGMNGCFASAKYEGDTSVFVGLYGTSGEFFFAFSNPSWKSLEEGKNYDIEINYGRQNWTGSFQGFVQDGQPAIRAGNLKLAFITSFARSKSISIRYKNKQLEKLSLKGSRDAVTLVQECVRGPAKGTANGGNDPFAE